jgi:hypothetical protein
MNRIGIALAVALAAGLAAAAADPRPRTFIGTFQVPPEKRDDVLKFLKEKGYPGAGVPDGAAPQTVVYRGPKAEYEAALDALNRYLHPEWYDPKAGNPVRVLPRKAPPKN